MAFTLITLKAAAEDIAGVYNYYEKAQKRLGDRFMSELLKRFSELVLIPNITTILILIIWCVM